VLLDVAFDMRGDGFVESVAVVVVEDALGKGHVLAYELLCVHILNGDEPGATRDLLHYILHK